MYPNYYNYITSFRETSLPNIKSYIRILHASPDAPPVDIYANGIPIGTNIAFKGFTNYISLAPGDYSIKIFPAGKKENPILEKTLDIPPKSILTVAAINELASLDLLPVLETGGLPKSNVSLIRFVHLSPNSSNIDITIPNGRKLFKNVEYKETTGYLPVIPQNYTIQLRDADTGDIILTVPNMKLKPNRLYTLYAVGLLGENPPLQLLIPLDGASYLT